MAEPLRIGSQIKALSNLLMREISNCAYGKSRDEATGINMLIIRYLAQRKNINSGIAKIEIEKKQEKTLITLHSAKPGIIIGKGGAEIEKLKADVNKLIGKDVHINIVEIKV